MRTHSTVLSLSALLLLNCGCSIFITSQGKDRDIVFAPKSTRQSVQRELGVPVGSQTYEHPIRLSDIPELTSLPQFQQPNDLTAFAGSYDDYRYKGIIYNLGAHQAAAMVVAESFGLGELWAFPESLRYTAAERKKEHFFRVSYSPTGFCVAYLWRPAEGQEKTASP